MKAGIVVWVMLTVPSAAAGAALGPEQVLTAFMSAFNARDPARTAALFSADAEFLPPDGPPVRGRADIQAAFAARFEALQAVDLLSMHSVLAGDLAYVTGRLSLSTRLRDGRADIASGSYLVVLRRVAGTWKIACHMFNLPLHPEFVG